jgi:DMSO/TMAO reductase YedYZ molybdopterin-dependent catalytic subunit
LKVGNEKGKETALSAEALAKLPRRTAKVKDRHGNRAAYEGVPLAAVLRAAGVTLGKDLRGPLLANCLLVEAADGYRVVFALPEVDPDLTDKVVLLADRKDGKPLAAAEGPYRLVVPDDKRPARWVKQVVRIRVVRPAPAAEKVAR